MFLKIFSCLFVFSLFRQHPSSGSLEGRSWGGRCIFFVYSRTMICVQSSKKAGHQIASTITTCTRTDEEPCIRGPLCSCTDTALFGTLLPAGSSNFGGRKIVIEKPGSAQRRTLAARCDDANFRSDHTFTRASPG